jgi:hypothetical protein
VNLTETHDLLVLIRSLDNRKVPDDLIIRAWQQILTDVDPADARQAVTDHFAASTEYLMPAHIVERAKAIRDQRHRTQHHPIRELAGRFEHDPDRADRAHRGAALVAATLGERDTDKPLDPDNPIRDLALRRARAERGTRSQGQRSGTAEPGQIGNVAARMFAGRDAS